MSNINFIPHVHWDREWLRSSDSSRVKLVYYFDTLIDLLENGKLKYFTFDGQTAALDDYLAIKPYNRSKICKLVTERKLLIGPWYTQPDMIMPSGEALVRNLLVGSNIAKNMGHCMNVGWIPDAFGQNQITPYLFNEFKMNGIFAWRGFDYDKLDRAYFNWRYEDTIMPTIHFPLGYGYYRGFPSDYATVKKDVDKFSKDLEAKFKQDEIMFMLGSDYAFPKAYNDEFVNKLSKDGYQCEVSNPELFMDKMIKLNENTKVSEYSGEARSAMLGRIHAGITSTRIDLKNQNRYYETLMAKTVEPISVVSLANGGHFDSELMNYYWKIIFKNQFHDSIYSSSPQTVNDCVDHRFLNLRHGLNELIWMNFSYLKDHCDLSKLSEDEDLLILYNNLPYQRDDYVYVSLITKYKDFTLEDFDGNKIDYVKLDEIKPENHEIEYYNGIINFHDGGEVIEGSKFKCQIKIKAELLPSLGYKLLKVKRKSHEMKINTDLKLLENGMENMYLKVTFEDGLINVLNKQNNEQYTKLHKIIDDGDDGDEYNYSYCKNPKDIVVNNFLTSTKLIENNPYEIKYRLDFEYQCPKEIKDHYQVDDTTTMSITVDVSLESESKQLNFETQIHNNCKDHRLRVHFKDNYASQFNCSQDQLGEIKRSNIINQKGIEEGATEDVLPLYAMQRYVRLDHKKTCFGLISGGPMEYEVLDNNTLTLTLLRCVGKFGKADLAVRPGRSSGYRLDVETSQLLNKTITSKYAIYFGENNNHEELIKNAEMFNCQALGRFIDDINRTNNDGLKDTYSFMSLDDRLELMALKKSEDNSKIVCRILNNTEEEVVNPHIEINYNKLSLLSVDETFIKEIDKLPNIKSHSFITIAIE